MTFDPKYQDANVHTLRHCNHMSFDILETGYNPTVSWLRKRNVVDVKPVLTNIFS